MSNTLRIVSFLLPVPKGTEARRNPTHQLVQTKLIKTFGGYTASPVTGAYVMDDGHVEHDNCIKYEVAVTSEGELLAYLIAAQAGKDLNQESVFFVDRLGGVMFITGTRPEVPVVSPTGRFDHHGYALGFDLPWSR